MTDNLDFCPKAILVKADASPTLANLDWHNFTLGDVANIATAFGLVIAFVGAFIAWRSYAGNLKDQARARMHELLRELLALEVSGVESPKGYIAFKFYAMEEIYIWALKNRPRFLSGMPWSDYNSWIETIRFHLGDDFMVSRGYFRSRSKIFDEKFRKFAFGYYGLENC